MTIAGRLAWNVAGRGDVMGLKITLKPFERIEIGPLTLTNGWIEPSTFLIEGIAPVLRQANSAAR